MRRSFIFCALAFAILLTQCSPVYVPNSRNTPMFTKAGEAQGAVLFGTSGLDFQGAVAVTNNIAIMISTIIISISFTKVHLVITEMTMISASKFLLAMARAKAQAMATIRSHHLRRKISLPQVNTREFSSSRLSALTKRLCT